MALFSFPFIFSAPVLPGWNLTITNETPSSFSVQWKNLTALLGSQVQHFIVLLKTSRNNVSDVVHKIEHGRQEKIEMTGLLSSTQYTVEVFGIDKMGKPYRTIEVQARTLTGKNVSYTTKCFSSFFSRLHQLKLNLNLAPKHHNFKLHRFNGFP